MSLDNVQDRIKAAEAELASAKKELERLNEAAKPPNEPFPVGTIITFGGRYGTKPILAVRLSSVHDSVLGRYPSFETRGVKSNQSAVWMTIHSDGSGSLYPGYDALTAKFRDEKATHRTAVSWT